jgi:putative restriction endonuclease
MDVDEFLVGIDNLRVNRIDGRGKALYKPLLILEILKRIRDGEANKFHFKNIKEELKTKMALYGGRGNNGNGHYPFYHLQTASFYKISGIDQNNDLHNGSAQITALMRPEVFSEIDSDLFKALSTSKSELFKVMKYIIDLYWSETVRLELLDTYNLTDLSPNEFIENNIRSNTFRKEVINNYQHSCGMCGFQSVMDDRPGFALDAAHVKWHSNGGSNELSNGIALCKLHHWAFDRGVLGISDNTIKVSPKFTYQENNSSNLISDLSGKIIRSPTGASLSSENCIWHLENKFLG